MSDKADIVLALQSSIDWHEQQGRPHSASVDRDALAEIERLRSAITLLHGARASTDPAWAAALVDRAVRESGA